mgnify:CR=1 FL=1
MPVSRQWVGMPSWRDPRIAVAAILLSYVVLGGRRSVAGPVIGTAILLILPEVSRPLADYRNALYGLILMLVIAYMPRGIYDTAVLYLRRRRLAASSTAEASK